MSIHLTHQESLLTEPESKNGTTKYIHYVVKNTPFSVHLEVLGVNFNFRSATLQCSLHYDENELKEVDAVKSQPLDYQMQYEGNGNKCSIQFKVRVLTTQHQGYHFVIRIRLVEKSGKFLEVLTEPIKSCSKMEQIRRKEAEKMGKKNAPKKKRARGEELLETLEEIKATQRAQSELLATLLMQNQMRMNTPEGTPNVLTPLSCASLPSPSQLLPSPSPSVVPSSGKDLLEEALLNVIRAYAQTDESERPSKIRCLYNNLSEDHKPIVREVGSLLFGSAHNENSSTDDNDSGTEEITDHSHVVTPSPIDDPKNYFNGHDTDDDIFAFFEDPVDGPLNSRPKPTPSPNHDKSFQPLAPIPLPELIIFPSSFEEDYAENNIFFNPIDELGCSRFGKDMYFFE